MGWIQLASLIRPLRVVLLVIPGYENNAMDVKPTFEPHIRPNIQPQQEIVGRNFAFPTVRGGLDKSAPGFLLGYVL
jgi:hypothetical protein